MWMDIDVLRRYREEKRQAPILVHNACALYAQCNDCVHPSLHTPHNFERIDYRLEF